MKNCFLDAERRLRQVQFWYRCMVYLTKRHRLKIIASSIGELMHVYAQRRRDRESLPLGHPSAQRYHLPPRYRILDCWSGRCETPAEYRWIRFTRFLINHCRQRYFVGSLLTFFRLNW